ncbi:MAG: dihydrofolate reductase family protein [Actinobacteria bacterium]|nr:dihydrofolate reductase family protein [Actinomycetota bacterium]
MRLLSSDLPGMTPGAAADDALLRQLYSFPESGAVRSNFVATLDGAGTGADGLTGSINNAADKVVFDLNRELADVVVVGAATLEAEGYGPSAGTKPLVGLSTRCLIPRGWLSEPVQQGLAILVTVEGAEPKRLAQARELLGEEHVWTVGAGQVDVAQVLVRLQQHGHRRILTEGGPRVHAELLRRGLIDELALTWVPQLVGGGGPRIAHGTDFTLDMRLRHLVESDGTLLGLWAR